MPVTCTEHPRPELIIADEFAARQEERLDVSLEHCHDEYGTLILIS